MSFKFDRNLMTVGRYLMGVRSNGFFQNLIFFIALMASNTEQTQITMSNFLIILLQFTTQIITPPGTTSP